MRLKAGKERTKSEMNFMTQNEKMFHGSDVNDPSSGN